ncbi:hypothetical protein ACFX12_014406 [Malus domestica]
MLKEMREEPNLGEVLIGDERWQRLLLETACPPLAAQPNGLLRVGFFIRCYLEVFFLVKTLTRNMGWKNEL